MPRQARKKSKSGIYHIMVRGINRQSIFEDDEDRRKFIETMKESVQRSEASIYGYCIMGNHVHMLIKETKESVSFTMQRICSSFVYWYNWKYDRFGHLFQERYKSEVVEDDKYLLTVLRYIHQNPIKAGLVKKIEKYKWSSYHEYLNGQIIIDADYILELFAPEKKAAIERFKEFMNTPNDDICLEYEDKHRITDDEIRKLIEERFKVRRGLFHTLEDREKRRILQELKAIKGATIRQLVRVTGVSKYTVEKA